MSEVDEKRKAIRGTAYLWESERHPEGREFDPWPRTDGASPGEEEKVLAGQPGANMPALLTKDVPGG